jgi:hypothetical protein
MNDLRVAASSRAAVNRFVVARRDFTIQALGIQPFAVTEYPVPNEKSRK